MRQHLPTVVLLAALCLAVAAAAPAREGTPPKIAAPVTPPPPAPDCDPGGLRALLTPGNVLLLGEIHGGVEGPALIGAAACAAARRGLAVLVALEIPREESERLRKFLASSGEALDRAALLTGLFWQRDFQDGRSSVAMLGLIDRLRSLRLQTGRADVVLLDSEAPFSSGQRRDDLMGQRLVEAVTGQPPGGLLLALAGNFHTRTTVGLPFDAAYRPAGLAVEQRWPERTVSLLLTAPPGETWMCPTVDPASCGVATLGGKPGGDPGAVELYAATREGYEGAVRLAASTASPPAIGATRSAAHPPT